jgi:hypothetical protein
MKEFDRIMREKKIDKQELLLELDLYPDEQGSAPALRTPPEFKVNITRRYLDTPTGTKWYDADTIRDHYQRMTSNHLLILVRNPDQSMSIYKLQIDLHTGFGKFSDEAMDAFSRALRNDDSRLLRVYGDPQMSQIKARRDVDTMR